MAGPKFWTKELIHPNQPNTSLHNHHFATINFETPSYRASNTANMSKRTAEADNGDLPLKDRDRPEAMDIDGDNRMGEFEDEFEDEFESEDEIFEAGVDGRPDAEREAEEKGEF